ncbi:MAG TPA: hypothetical protein VK085_13485, partial [Pseudogracilibacillus sp.]|nr:hypothetical protein [Pseudogracilibacillus sp.]
REKNTKMSNGETISWREGMFYFIGPHTATAQLNIINHKNSFKDAVGSQSLELFEKYQVDLLGNLYRVNKEKRYVLQALYEKS